MYKSVFQFYFSIPQQKRKNKSNTNILLYSSKSFHLFLHQTRSIFSSKDLSNLDTFSNTRIRSKRIRIIEASSHYSTFRDHRNGVHTESLEWIESQAPAPAKSDRASVTRIAYWSTVIGCRFIGALSPGEADLPRIRSTPLPRDF